MSKIMFMDNEYSGNYVGLIDFFYPIGSYYETSDTTFNPNSAWGGTWVLENAGYVHVSGASSGTYTISGATGDSGKGTKDGGSEYIQAHTHGFTNPTYKASGGAVTDKAAFNTTSSGFIDNGITGGSHSHKAVAFVNTAGSGSSRRQIVSQSNTETVDGHLTTNAVTHTHDLPKHTHSNPAHGHGFTQPTISQSASGSVNAVKDVSTGQAGNMQPYIVVNRWHRTA